MLAVLKKLLGLEKVIVLKKLKAKDRQTRFDRRRSACKEYEVLDVWNLEKCR